MKKRSDLAAIQEYLDSTRPRIQASFQHNRKLLQSLTDVAIEIYQGGKLQKGDRFGLMAACFLAKQINHAKTVILLNENLDLQLIARTMLEGAAILMWASKEPIERSAIWLSYLEVSHYKNVLRWKSGETTVDPAYVLSAKEKAVASGARFVKGKYKDASKIDPFTNEWLPENRREIFKQAKAERFYVEVYGLLSEWEHWNVGIVPRLLDVSNSAADLPPRRGPNWTQSAFSCGSVAFYSLMKTSQIFNKHFRTFKGSELSLIGQKYIG